VICPRQPGGVIGGEGWIAGPDGRHISIRTGWAVRWDADEEHTAGTETGLSSLAKLIAEDQSHPDWGRSALSRRGSRGHG
jgi:hypothetical protein